MDRSDQSETRSLLAAEQMQGSDELKSIQRHDGRRVDVQLDEIPRDCWTRAKGQNRLWMIDNVHDEGDQGRPSYTADRLDATT